MRLFLTAALLAGLALPVAALAQPAAYLKGAQRWEDSQTGISGRWNMQGHIPSSRGPRAQATLAYTEEGKPPPLLPEIQALWEKRLVESEHGKPFAHMGTLCLPEGIPLMLFAAVEGPIQIFETPGQVTIVSQEFNEVWLIYLNEKHPDPKDIDPSWHGDSVGHWEGDTLVIDTIGLTDKTSIDYTGIPHSADLRVVTRLRRLDKDTLEVRATHYDPKTFSAPWTRKRLYKKGAHDQRLEEEVCDNQRNGISPDGQATFLTYDDTQAGKVPGQVR
jgi:hypothetical protein